MSQDRNALEKLVDQLMKFPGIGRRSAERITDYILHSSKEEVSSLLQAIVRVKEHVRHCQLCNNLSEAQLCRICNDVRRSKDIICVVENPKDVEAIEKTGSFRGLYHVLMGAISPLEGKGPQDLKIDSLIRRVKQNSAKEIIIATDADTEGEITALYLTKELKPSGVKITRIGLGLPVGGNLEYSDPTTLSHALASRREV